MRVRTSSTVSLGRPAAAVEPVDERESVLALLFTEHHTALVRLATLLGAGAEAEDMVSEAFYRVFRHWERDQGPEAVLPYLRATVCNLTRMRARHLAVVRRHDLAAPTSGDVASAEVEVVLREDQREVVEALANLPERQRQALVLRYWMGLREAEVAAAMGISCGAVKTHTSRGMAALHRSLEGRR